MDPVTMKDLYDTLSGLVGDDTTTFLNSTIGLFINDATPAYDSVAGDFDPATFTGYAVITVTSVSLNVSTDPATGDQIWTLVPPAAGWYWEVTGATGLPQTVFGWRWKLSGGELIEGARLDEPIVLTAIGNSINLGPIRVRVPAGTLLGV